MKCQNCGTESNFEWATYCRNCSQKLGTVKIEEPAEVVSNDTATFEVKSLDETASFNADRINEMKSILRQDIRQDSEQRKDPQDQFEMEISEQVSPEPIENELTLYRDDKLKLTLSESNDNQALTIESVKNNTKITAISEDSIEVTEHFNDFERDPMIETFDRLNKLEKEPVPLPEKEIAETPDLQNQAMEKPEHRSSPTEMNSTSAIETQPEQEKPKPSSNLGDIKLNLGEIKQSKGVIYIAGKNLKLTGGMKVEPGDEITINSKPFQVKREKKNNRNLIYWISGGAIGLVLLIIIAASFFSGDSGTMVGTLTDGDTSRPLRGVPVRLIELNKTARTSEAGFFIFEDIPNGLYTIEFRAPNGKNVQDKITVIKNQTTTAAIVTEPANESSTGELSPLAGSPNHGSVIETASSGSGNLKLTIEPNSASIYIDGKPVGVGSNTFKLSSGPHSLAVKKDGYTNYSRNVNIEADKTHALNIDLKQAGSAGLASQKSGLDAAFEKEAASKYDEASRMYDLIIKGNPLEVKAYLGKARCARENGDLQGAANLFQHASNISADKKDPIGQIESLTGLIEIRPNLQSSYSSRGDIYYNIKEYKKASLDYKKVVELDKKNLNAYYKLGNSYYALAQFDDALSVYLAAEELNFADPRAHVSLAKTYLALGDKRNLKKSYEKYSELASYTTRLELKNDPDWQKVLSFLGKTE